MTASDGRVGKPSRTFACSAFVAFACATGGCADDSVEAMESPFTGFEQHNAVLAQCNMVQANEIGAHDATDGTMTAAELVALIEGERWQPLRLEYPAGQPAGSLEAMVRVGIRMVSSPRWMDGMDEPLYHGLTCPSWLEADVEVTLSSDDGEIAERFAAYAWTYDSALVHISAAAPGEAVDGSLTGWLAARLPADATPLGFELGLSFSADGWGALIEAYLPSGATGFHEPRGTRLPIGYIGTARCSYQEAPIALDRGAPITGEELLSRFDLADPLHIEWSDGTSAAVNARFEPDYQGTCLWAYETETALSVPGVFTLESDDGRLLGSYHTEIGAARTESTVATIWQQPAAPTTTELGFPMAMTDGVVQATLELQFSISASGDLDASIELVSYFNNDCTYEIEHGEQCAAYESTVLTGTITR